MILLWNHLVYYLSATATPILIGLTVALAFIAATPFGRIEKKDSNILQ